VDMAEIIGKALNAKPQLVSVTGQNRIPMLVDRRVDILLSVGWSAERAKVIDYTAAYAPYYVAVIGPASIKVTGKDDLAGKTIAVNRGTLEDTTLTEIAPPAADIRRFDNYNSVLQAFLSQQTQLIAVGNDVGAQIFARRADLKPEQKFQLRISPTHIGMNKNEERLKAKLDEVVNRLMADGTLDGLSQKWLGKPLDPKDLKSAAAL
jgi:polar amino acid transport system substrate-binding protein